MVPKSALVPFSPDNEPYVGYVKTVKRFLQDASIVRATAYWNTGEIPPTFKWLSVIERIASRKRSVVSESGLTDSEGEIVDIDPTFSTALPKKKNGTKKQGRPKTVGRPKKSDGEESKPIIRRASVEIETAKSVLKHTIPTPKFKPLSLVPKITAHLQPPLSLPKL